MKQFSGVNQSLTLNNEQGWTVGAQVGTYLVILGAQGVIFWVCTHLCLEITFGTTEPQTPSPRGMPSSAQVPHCPLPLMLLPILDVNIGSLERKCKCNLIISKCQVPSSEAMGWIVQHVSLSFLKMENGISFSLLLTKFLLSSCSYVRRKNCW